MPIYHLAAAFASPHSHIEYLQINGLGTLHFARSGARESPQFAAFCLCVYRSEYTGRLKRLGVCSRSRFPEDHGQSDSCDAVFFDQVDRRRIGDELPRSIRRSECLCVGLRPFLNRVNFLTEDGVPKFCSLRPVLERLRRV